MIRRYIYSAFNLTIASDIEFPTCKLSDSETTDLVIKSYSFMNTSEVHHFVENDFNRVGDDYFIYVLDVAKFHVTHDVILYEVMRHVDKAILIPYFLGLVIATVLQVRGQLALHGSSLQIDNRNLVVMGDSGSGKSTLCNRLIQEGAHFITDDVICFRDTLIGLRVLPDFGISKVGLDYLRDTDPVIPVMYYDDPRVKYYQCHPVLTLEEQAPAKKVIAIRQTLGGRVRGQLVYGAEKVKILIDNIYREGLLCEEHHWQDVVKEVMKIASQVDLYLIRRPKDEDTKEEVYHLVKEWMMEEH